MREKIKEIIKRDLMPFPNKQDKLEYTEEDVVLIAETFAKEHLQEQLQLHVVSGCFSGDDLKEVYELGRTHEKNKSGVTGDDIKEVWINADKCVNDIEWE